MKSRFVIIECAGYILWQLFLQRLREYHLSIPARQPNSISVSRTKRYKYILRSLLVFYCGNCRIILLTEVPEVCYGNVHLVHTYGVSLKMVLVCSSVRANGALVQLLLEMDRVDMSIFYPLTHELLEAYLTYRFIVQLI